MFLDVFSWAYLLLRFFTDNQHRNQIKITNVGKGYTFQILKLGIKEGRSLARAYALFILAFIYVGVTSGLGQELLKLCKKIRRLL